MKKLFLITALLVSSLTYSQIEDTSGIFEFNEETIDYGTINKNADGKRTFTFKNIGNSPIIITNVKGSCGCTVATKPENPILPGESSSIEVNYATNRIGGFSKTITITSNASEPKKVLRIKGNVLKSSVEASISKIQ
ncbi:DUF1573 domain-containing protein [Urechidicola croceus]|uniref:DUF1573 domain-containing protein n=1 Tax=Urechidicola croceus TaxID=1850246 RepID=A0A1D8P4T6_9FLAO|nr:DUF1573 domain-containing protein [Urechidicola croceus]AOW19583.1 hypothetical protein LPB138_02325 [Urechidicola croceus]